MKAKFPAVKISHNAGKPRKGAFVVTVHGERIVNLLEMPRPFTKLRELGLQGVVADVVAALSK